MIAWLRAWLESRRIRNLIIDPNSKCPGCGHRNGKLKVVLVGEPKRTVMMEHACQVCAALWYEPTIVKPEKWVAAETLRPKA